MARNPASRAFCRPSRSPRASRSGLLRILRGSVPPWPRRTAGFSSTDRYLTKELVDGRGEGGQCPGAQLLKDAALRWRNRFSALHLECDARVTLHSVDEHLEMKVRARCEACSSDSADRASDGDPLAASYSLCKVGQVPIATDKAVAVTDGNDGFLTARAT